VRLAGCGVLNVSRTVNATHAPVNPRLGSKLAQGSRRKIFQGFQDGGQLHTLFALAKLWMVRRKLLGALA
jgi:hypothetical protein